MKKTAIFLLSLLSILVVGCSNENGGDSSSSSSSVAETSGWSEEQKTLLEEYCGSLIPFPGKMLGNKISFSVIEEDSGSTYLQITDNATSSRFMEYYKNLAESGWNILKGYDGEYIQKENSGTEYVIATKKDEEKGKGYELLYFYKEASFTTGGISPSCNVIKCFNDLDYEAKSATAWEEDDASAIKNALATDIPYVALGESGYVYKGYSNAVILTDQYAEDLSSSYYSALIDDGYVYDKAKSDENYCYYLTKTLSDGAAITTTLRYTYGNYFVFLYTPNPTKSETWPSAFAKEIKEATGFEPPAFVSGESKSEFRTYKKNDTYYIEGDTYYDNPTWDYTSLLDKEYHLSQKELGGPYVDFDESFKVTVNDLYDEDNNTVGMQIGVTKTVPTSTFSASWPTEAISSTIESVLGVESFSLPPLTDISSYTDKNIKYSILGEDYVQGRYEYYLSDIAEYPSSYSGLPENYTEQDIKDLASALATAEAGIKIEIEDKEPYLSSDAYEKTLTEACYYRETVSDSSAIGFEDKDGKIGVSITTVNSDYGYGNTTIFIHGGSKKAHNPEFGFYQESYKANIGASLTPTLIKNMLPYSVTYSFETGVDGFSVTEKGVVKVDSGVKEGTKAILIAALSTPEGKTFTDSCSIVAAVFDDYSAEGTMDLVLGYLENQGFDAPKKLDLTKIDLTYFGAELRFEDREKAGVSVSSLEKLVEEHLIPKSFELRASEDKGPWSTVTNCDFYTGKAIGEGNWNDYYFVNQEGKDQIMLEFSVYTPYDNEKALVLRIMSFDCLSVR